MTRFPPLSYTSHNSLFPGWLMCTFLCLLLCPLPPSSLYWLSSNYSLPSSTQNSPLPSTRHHRLESSCGDRVWTLLTLVFFWTLELFQAALKGLDWKDPVLGCCTRTAATCSLAIYMYLSFPK